MKVSTLPDLLIEATRCHPDRIAVIAPTGRLTWSELRCRSGHLAFHLSDIGIEPDSRVAICLPKSPELLISVWGTLLAGGCYVPIDHAMPGSRARIILEDAGAAALICTARVAERWFGISGESAERFRAVLVRLDGSPLRSAVYEPLPDTPEPNVQVPSVAVHPGSMAYILYTSGSTGRPKGVVHTHGSALPFVRWAAGNLDLRPNDVLSQHASPSFDLTIFDFFCSALSGAAIAFVPEWLFGQVARTCRFISETGITVWYSVPSALLRPAAPAALEWLISSQIRWVVFAGEAIPKQELARFMGFLPLGCKVSNWYGPTETNVCTFHDIEPTDLESEDSVPIGIPCPYATVELDPDTAREPVGATELLVDSLTNMRGYWKLGERTALSLCPGRDGRRFYRTGDLVLWRAGKLLFLGRRDRLLKLTGYRVQPEEVEQALLQQAGIREAAVVAISHEGENRLVAAVVFQDGENSLPQLAQHCTEMLPAYMVPYRIVALEVLPRGSRGKIDLQAVSALLSASLVPASDAP